MAWGISTKPFGEEPSQEALLVQPSTGSEPGFQNDRVILGGAGYPDEPAGQMVPQLGKGAGPLDRSCGQGSPLYRQVEACHEAIGAILGVAVHHPHWKVLPQLREHGFLAT